MGTAGLQRTGQSTACFTSSRSKDCRMEISANTISIAVTVMAMSLALILAATVDRANREGLGFLTLGVSTFGLGMLMIGLRPFMPREISVLSSNTLLIAAYALFVNALLVFQKRRWHPSVVWLPVAIAVIVNVMFIADALPRVLMACAISVIESGYLGYLLWSRRKVTQGRGHYFVFYGAALFAGGCVMRMGGILAGQAAALAHSQLFETQALQSLATIVSLIFIAFGFVLMAKERTDHHNRILSLNDELTGLANRRLLQQTLHSEVPRNARARQSLALVMIDVDHFKKYNDHYGHPAGDVCLKAVANRILLGARRASDLAARYGGEEFVLVLPNTDETTARHIAESVRQAVEACQFPHCASPHGWVTISLGLAVVDPYRQQSPEELLTTADLQLYEAKKNGRNCVAVHTSTARTTQATPTVDAMVELA